MPMRRLFVGAARQCSLLKHFSVIFTPGDSISLHAASHPRFHSEGSRMLSTSGSGESTTEDNELLDWRRTINGVICDSQFEQEMDDFLLSKAVEEGAESNRLAKTGLSAESMQTASTIGEGQLKEAKPVQQASPDTSSASSPWQFSNKFGTNRARIPSSGADQRSNGDDLLMAIAKETRQNILRPELFNDPHGPERDRRHVASLFGPLNELPVYEPGVLPAKGDFAELATPTGAESGEQDVPTDLGAGFRVNVYRNITGSTKVLLNSLRQQILEAVSERIQQAGDSPRLPFMKQFLDILQQDQADPKMDVRFRMNQVCAALLERLPMLSPDELALVCLVFGELGYTNSLVFYHLLGELQKPETLSSMKTDALSGTILSLGMLQSTDSEFFGNVLVEFRHRFQARGTTPIPPYTFASLLLGCCHLKDPNTAERYCIGLMEMLCQDISATSWSDLAITVYVMAQLKVIQSDVLNILHGRLTREEGYHDLTCTPCAVLLMGLEKIMHLTNQRLHHPLCKHVYSLLEDRIGELISDDQIVVTSIPDLIRSLSFPELERTEYYPVLTKRLLKDGSVPMDLPLWTLVFRLMAGYANVMYRDPVLLKALNHRFCQAKWAQVSGSTVAQLLHIGYRLRGLEEKLVDRLVELMSSSMFWDRLYRSKDAARIAYSLAGFQKLTPQIFQQCWKRCAATPFSQYGLMQPQECVDTMFIAQGLFDGYQYIRHRFSPSEARKHISYQGHRDLYKMIRTKNLAESGPQTAAQKAIAEYLQGLGVRLTHPALLEGGLYRADLALHDAKVHAQTIGSLVGNAVVQAVVLIPGMRAYYSTPPYEMNGALLIKKRSMEAHRINVILIREKEWLDTPDEDKEHFLKQQFAMEGLHLDKLCRREALESAEDTMAPSKNTKTEIREWLESRSIVLNRLLKNELAALLKERMAVLQDPQQEDFSQLAEAALIENKVLIPDASGKKRSLSSKRKGDLIKDILSIEAGKLFGDRRPMLQSQGPSKTVIHGS